MGGALRAMARAYHNNTQSLSADSGRCPLPMGVVVPDWGENQVHGTDRRRVMVHPSYPLVVGKGIYEYPHNPAITRNFIWHPGRKVDATGQRTISSNVLVQVPQAWEDVVITEIWLAGSNRLAALAEMFHVFYQYWNTIPSAGAFIGWCPFDVTTDRFAVGIVRVALGDVDYEYSEVREHITRSREGAYISSQLTLQFKLLKPSPPPMDTITVEGL